MSKFDEIHGAPHNPNNPFKCCYDCPDRYPACSDKCKKHAEATEIRKEQKRQEGLEKALGRADKTRAMRNARHKQ